MCGASLQVAPLWFGAQLAFNFSLSMTNITSNTILSSTSGLFTYVLSCLLLGEAFNLVKLLSILVCITGAPPFQIACVCKVTLSLGQFASACFGSKQALWPCTLSQCRPAAQYNQKMLTSALVVDCQNQYCTHYRRSTKSPTTLLTVYFTCSSFSQWTRDSITLGKFISC